LNKEHFEIKSRLYERGRPAETVRGEGHPHQSRKTVSKRVAGTFLLRGQKKKKKSNGVSRLRGQINPKKYRIIL